MKAPLCIWSSYYGLYDPEMMVREFQKDGIHNIELSFEHSRVLLNRDSDEVSTGKKFKEYMSEHGIIANQGHLEFPTHFVTNPETLPNIVRELRLFEALGIKCAILHCDPMNDVEIEYDERRKLNIEKLRMLDEMIKDIDVTICLENLGKQMRGVDEIIEIIEELNSEKFGICLDTGHLNITGVDTQEEFIKKAGKHLKALHLHDNNGSSDQHILPYGRGKIDFDKLVSALKVIDYKGEFNFEIPGESSAPLYIKHAKIAYVKEIYEYLMSL